jgi:hypothetical protein
MNANYVLVCVEKPKDHLDDDGWNRWQLFLADVERSAIPKQPTAGLPENVWLFQLSRELHPLHRLLGILDKHARVAYSVHWIAGEVEKCLVPVQERKRS